MVGLTKNKIRKVAVLGAGVMGAQIAAHFTNAGIATILFDLPSKEGASNAIAQSAIQNLKKITPAPLATSDLATSITAADYGHHLHLLDDCDLVIEAIAEKLEYKVALFNDIASHIGDHTIVASNTSGLSINELAVGLPEHLRPRFMGMHFFNPPRYMPLVELIPCESTLGALVTAMEEFLVSKLGKGVVRAKDTPNFIANRIGVFSMLATLRHAEEFDIPIEVVDALTGTLIGRPKSATFRTMDVVGLDTMAHVVDTMRQQLKDDPWHELFALPDYIGNLVSSGALGQKTGKGLYQKQGKEILVFDVSDKVYRPAIGQPDAAVIAILQTPDPINRMQLLRDHAHPQAKFLWACYRDLFHYCACQIESIAHTVADVDLAMRWGFGWVEGPFETWQRSDWMQTRNFIEKEIKATKTLGIKDLPAWVYDINDPYTKNGAFSPHTNTSVRRNTLPIYKRQEFPELLLGERHNTGKVIFENEGVHLHHSDDNSCVLSFKSKLNTISSAVMEGIFSAIEIAEKNYGAMIIWQPDAANFCAGANLKEFFPVFASNNVDDIIKPIHRFQQSVMALKYAQIPVVAAVRGRALGGGCELLLHCDRVVSALESYIGLVEIGVGLLPAGGGCKELALRAATRVDDANLLPAIEKSFRHIAMAQVSASASDAQRMKLLRDSDVVVMNPHEVLFIAKQQAHALAQSAYQPPMAPRFRVAGKTGIATLQMMLVNMKEGQFISDYDYFLALQIATVLCGGNVEADSIVDEEWMLKLEREAFAHLAMQRLSQDRIRAMLDTGKPLRN